jgi:hypothetical protein
MPRDVSSDFGVQARQQETSRVLISLLTITHPDLMGILRLTDFAQPGLLPFTSRGNVFSFFPFKPVLPTDTATASGEIRITAPNINGVIVDELRALGLTYPQVLLEQVTDHEPDTVQVTFNLILLSFVSDLITLTATLGWENISKEPYPYQSVTPQYFPGLYR